MGIIILHGDNTRPGRHTPFGQISHVYTVRSNPHYRSAPTVHFNFFARFRLQGDNFRTKLVAHYLFLSSAFGISLGLFLGCICSNNRSTLSLCKHFKQVFFRHHRRILLTFYSHDPIALCVLTLYLYILRTTTGIQYTICLTCCYWSLREFIYISLIRFKHRLYDRNRIHFLTLYRRIKRYDFSLPHVKSRKIRTIRSFFYWDNHYEASIPSSIASFIQPIYHNTKLMCFVSKSSERNHRHTTVPSHFLHTGLCGFHFRNMSFINSILYRLVTIVITKKSHGTVTHFFWHFIQNFSSTGIVCLHQSGDSLHIRINLFQHTTAYFFTNYTFADSSRIPRFIDRLTFFLRFCTEFTLFLGLLICHFIKSIVYGYIVSIFYFLALLLLG